MEEKQEPQLSLANKDPLTMHTPFSTRTLYELMKAIECALQQPKDKVRRFVWEKYEFNIEPGLPWKGFLAPAVFPSVAPELVFEVKFQGDHVYEGSVTCDGMTEKMMFQLITNNEFILMQSMLPQ